MNFNALRFLTNYNIPYWTEGPNCQEGWYNIQCPLCDDNTNHLGINPIGGYTNCWKCGGHNLKKIIKELLRITYDEAEKIINEYDERISTVHRLNKKLPGKQKVILPGEELGEKHKKYLIKRKFDPELLEKKYKLKGTGICGEWKFRIIIPIIFRGRVVSFQGRDISGVSHERYKTLHIEKSLENPKSILYNFDNAKLDKVIVTEGPFDCMRMSDNSVATLGTSLTDLQIKLLSKFKQIFFLFDDNEEEALQKAESGARKLSSIGCKVEVITGYCPKGKKDPAELSDEETRQLKKELGFI